MSAPSPENVDAPARSWANLPLCEASWEALRAAGIVQPTAVQAAAMPPLLAGSDALVRSGTGTGKTLAYLLPLLHRAAQPGARRLLILAPSPELAAQILHAIERFAPPAGGSLGLLGSGSLARQKERLKRHPQVLVGTPGRVCELIFARKIKTAQIGTLVLDEADQILDAKNAANLQEIASRPEFDAQCVCVSAAFGPPTQAFVRAAMRPEVVQVQLDQTPLHGRIEHYLVQWDARPGTTKDQALLRALERFEIRRAILFVNKLFSVGHLYNLLCEAGYTCRGLSSQRSKQQRQQALAAFGAGEVQFLVATDTAAHGLDVADLAWVVHYEAGRDADTYLHRAGRTGRAGRSGSSLVLAARRDVYSLEGFAKRLQITFERP